ncbi:MAG: hypothetical protein ABEJ98_05370 [Candidatus Nanohaloarchaea archaeon]
MKGQTQAVTATLITTVIVGSVATAYVWGVPLLEKQQSQANLQNVEQKVLSVYETVTSVSNSGTGTAEKVTVKPPSGDTDSFQVSVNERKDYIEITTNSQNPPYPLDTWTLIKGKSLQNLTFGAGNYALSGSDLPGVVGVRPVGGPGAAVIAYRIEFRNMLSETATGRKLTKIDLEARGKKRSTGETTLVFSNQGIEKDTGSDAVEIGTGEELDRSRTVISVDLR